MRPRRSALAMLAALILVAFCLPAVSQTGSSGSLSNKEINDLKREIQHKERRLKSFESAIRKLETAARQSSNSSARKAVENAEDLMREVIRVEEQKLGQDYTITQHGEEAETVHTNDLTDERGVRTNSRRRYALPADTPPEYIRLVRLQEIYVTLQRSREQAITRTGGAPERYGNLVREFADLMRTDLAELQAKLPEQDDPVLYYPMKTDSTKTK